MSTIGRWGITRDADGTLANLLEWPWYWRYPSSLALVVGGLGFAYWLAEHTEKPLWVAGLIAAAGVLSALVFAYEAGILAVFIGFIWAFVALGQWLFPSFEWSPKWVAVLSAIAAIYLWGLAKNASLKADAHDSAIANIWKRLNQAEESRQEGAGNLWGRLVELEARVRKLEKNDLDIDWSP